MTPAKFNFDTEFRSDGDRVSMAARARAKRLLSQDEIDQMCARARAEGMKTGEGRALDLVAHGANEAGRALRELVARIHEEVEILRRDAVEIAFAAARKLAPMALDALPSADVERALREAIHQAIGEPRIVLRVSARVAEALDGRIAKIAQEEGYEGRIILGADPAIKGADCRIEWRGGGAERSEAAIADAFAQLIERRFPHQSIPVQAEFTEE
jgi:flagellar assembly protein FliH